MFVKNNPRHNPFRLSVMNNVLPPSFFFSPIGKVARTGFEPVISALRGQRPRPLDERAALPTKDCNLLLTFQQ
jgi:hypothetical protein